MEVQQLAVHRGRVYLEVARVYDASDRGLYPKPDAVHDAVGHPDELDIEYAELYLVAGPHRDQLNFFVQLVLFELCFDKAQCEAGAVDRDVKLFKEVRQCAGMVLVPVRDEYAPQLLPVLKEVGEVGYHYVHTQHRIVREHYPAVDEYHVVAVLENSGVEAYLPDPAQRDHGKGGFFFERGTVQWPSYLEG